MVAVGVFGSQSHEVNKLAYIARIMTARSDNGVVYEVGDTYYDFGHDWKWTTILAYRSPNSHWQALYPTDQRKIFNAETREELDFIAQELMDEKQKAYPSLYSFRKNKKEDI